MASVALIACCLVNILGKQPLHQDLTAILLDMLMLSVDIENKTCPEIDLLVCLPEMLRYSFLMHALIHLYHVNNVLKSFV